jgi:hypothetical protein
MEVATSPPIKEEMATPPSYLKREVGKEQEECGWSSHIPLGENSKTGGSHPSLLVCFLNQPLCLFFFEPWQILRGGHRSVPSRRIIGIEVAISFFLKRRIRRMEVDISPPLKGE